MPIFIGRGAPLTILRQSTLREHQGNRRCAIARLGGAFSSFDRGRHRPLRDGALTMRCFAFDRYTKPVA
jgi:hypothetical protein